MPQKVLFINHPEKECGVHQFGENVFSAIASSGVFEFIYCECSNAVQFKSKVKEHQPAAVIYNYYESTMPWFKSRLARKYDFPHLGIMHEVTQERVNTARSSLFDYHIAPDPTLLLTNPIVFKTGRLIPSYNDNNPSPSKLTIGSFGFGTKGKGYTHIIEAVQNEFDDALIKFNIPFARFGDASGEGAKAYAEACRVLIKKPGIQLQITHDFLSQQEVLNFLSGNTLNCFFYDENQNRGISSVIDMALAVNKPLAITKSNMFRNVVNSKPSICIEDTSLRQIIQNGVASLEAYKKEWTPENLCWDYERIIKSSLKNFNRQFSLKSKLIYLIEKTPARRVLKKLKKISNRSTNRDKLMLGRIVVDRKEEYAAYHIPTERIIYRETLFNRILDNKARRQYEEVIKLLCQLSPEEMSRKIPEANIQQAFVFEAVRNLSQKFNSPRILSVGCYEDTAFLALQKTGYKVEGIDPLLNYDLTTFLDRPGVRENKYDIIFSTSVIEHVENDERFVKEMSEILKPGGFVILTCDFKEGYKKGDKVPDVDFRFYTKHDLEKRLPSQMPGCNIYSEHSWDCPQPDFWFDNINYTFASFVVKKD